MRLSHVLDHAVTVFASHEEADAAILVTRVAPSELWHGPGSYVWLGGLCTILLVTYIRLPKRTGTYRRRTWW